jgi:hypothetical protein
MLSTKQGILNVVVGVSISLFNALTQFLTMYFILQRFGTEFNGFVRLVTSVSTIFATADGTLGIATVLLLIKPLMKSDWISANEIYSTAKKSYRKGAWTALGLVVGISILYPLFVSVGGMNGIFNSDSWKSIGLDTMNANGNTDFVAYWQLIFISIALGMKNFATSFFFGVYENLISADNRSAIKRIAILITDTAIYGIFLAMITGLSSISPVVPFLIILLYSPLKGLLCYVYAKRKFPWLKYHRDINNFRLQIVAGKLRAPSIGIAILQNLDIVITSIFFGLNVSSDLSLFLVLAVNVRLVMANFITSFREYFTTLIAKNGRIYWKSYVKYELYTYLVVGFTFINLTLLSPYFVNALYGEIARNSLATASTKDTTAETAALSNVLDFIFSNFWFSGIFAFSTSLSLLCESQMTLIQSKGQTGEVAKFQNINGAIYLVCAIVCASIFGIGKVGGEQHLVYGILSFYILKSAFQIARYSYLWIFVWKYITYNSEMKYVVQNFMNFILSIVGTGLFAAFVYNKTYPVNVLAIGDLASMEPLVAIFFATIFGSIIYLFVVSVLLEPMLFAGIFKNLPIINELIGRKRKERREKRLEDNNIDPDKVVEKVSLNQDVLLAEKFDTLELTTDFEEMKISDNKPIYKIKG